MRMVTDITIAHLNSTKVETVLLPRLVADLYRSFKTLENQDSTELSASSQPSASATSHASVTSAENSTAPAPLTPERSEERATTGGAQAGTNGRIILHSEELGQPQVSELSGYRQPQTDQVPAVPIDQSVQWDYIVCLEDGKHLQMLKRYLRTRYQMSMEQYRAKWGLPPDYPATAPGYSAQKSEMAKRMGLGKAPRGSRRKRAGE